MADRAQLMRPHSIEIQLLMRNYGSIIRQDRTKNINDKILSDDKAELQENKCTK